MISAWFGGVSGGIGATLLSVVSIYYFFTIPYTAFTLKQLPDIIRLSTFAGEGIIISYFIDSGYRYRKISLYKKKEKENEKRIALLEKQLQDAHKETALRDEFLAIASHELKTPLTTVVLQIQTSLHNIRNVSLSEFSVEHLLKMLQSMQNQTKRLSQMINDLLNISLITTHKMSLEIEDVDLVTLVKDIGDSFAQKLEKDNIQLSIGVKDSIVGKWDKLRLEQVLDNLISNAIKYGNKKPIKIELQKKGSNAVIRVIDKGIGIKDSDKNQIFSLFKRGANEKDIKGLGIGLYIAQQIVLLHKGKIEFESEYDEGTMFTVTLPLHVR